MASGTKREAQILRNFLKGGVADGLLRAVPAVLAPSSMPWMAHCNQWVRTGLKRAEFLDWC